MACKGLSTLYAFRRITGHIHKFAQAGWSKEKCKTGQTGRMRPDTPVVDGNVFERG